jgi:hypothetical protein
MDDSPETVLSAVTTGPYVARAWVRAGSTSAVGKRVRLFIREGTPGPTGRYLRMVGGPLVTLSNTWQEITQQLTAQTAGNELEVIIGMESGAASGDIVYVDKVSMSAP